jgi:ABC-type sulfate transport system permease subunit
MIRHGGRSLRRVGTAVAGGAVGLTVAVIVVLNLHILVGLEEGYAATAREVWDRSVLLALVDIALLVTGAVSGFVLAWRWSGRSLQRDEARAR